MMDVFDWVWAGIMAAMLTAIVAAWLIELIG